jgi:DNA polymerase I-like protein with 3'-5' exonuclease and polymerase domains
MEFIVTKDRKRFKDIGWDGKFCAAEDVIRYFSDKKSVQLDIEASGLSFKTSRMYSIAFGDPEHQFVVDLDTVDIQLFKELIQTKLIIGQNLGYDLTFLYDRGIIPDKIWDTFLAEYVLTMGMPPVQGARSLGGLARKYLEVELDKSTQSTIAETGLASASDIHYAAADVRYLTDIAKLQLAESRRLGVEGAINLENEFVRVIAYIEYCGIKVDTDRWMSHVRKIEHDEYKAWVELTEYYLSISGDNTGYTFPMHPVNWNSSPQVIEVLQSLGVPTFDQQSGKDTVDAKFLVKYADKHPLVPMYLKYREINKEVTTYGREWLKNVLPDGRVHTKYRSMVDTGRTACGDARKGPFPNMQNLPASTEIRNSFIPTTKNHTFVVCDYSSQESVLLADMSKERNLLDFYINGEADLHSYAASKIWTDIIGDTPIADVKKKFPELRQQAKSANFAISYGGSGFTIANNLNIPKKQGEQVYEAYMAAFPGLAAFFEEQKKKVMRSGYILINNVTGRKRFGADIKQVGNRFESIDWSRYKQDAKYKESCLPIIKAKSAIEREALNTPIQGTAADMSKMAGVLFFKWILEKKLFGKVMISIFVHDEYVVECTKGKSEMVAEKLKECMETAGSMFLTTLPIKAEPVISTTWEH